MAHRDEPHDRPATHERAPRQSYLLMAKLLTHEGLETDFLVRNISDQGVGGEVRGHHEMKPGDPVKILLSEDAKLDGTLKWVRWSAIGVRLGEEIDAAHIRQLILRAGRSDESWEVSQLHKVDPPKATPQKRRRLL